LDYEENIFRTAAQTFASLFFPTIWIKISRDMFVTIYTSTV
jgi:hypothetical protein